mgnify:CR=1 FL=1
MNNKPNFVFVSYASDDALTEDNLIDKFLKHGKPRERRDEIEIFRDTERINHGDEWRKKIDAALEKTDIAILMISVNFLASDFIMEHELKVLLKKYSEEGIRVLPVLLGTCDWDYEPDLEQFQIFPSANEPLDSMNDSTFNEKAVEFFRDVLPENYLKLKEKEDLVTQRPDIHDPKNKDDWQAFEKDALERWSNFPDDVSQRYYTPEDIAAQRNIQLHILNKFLTENNFSKSKYFKEETPWFFPSQQGAKIFTLLNAEKLDAKTKKLTKDDMVSLLKKYHEKNYEEYETIFNKLLSWGEENLINKNLGTIYWGQNTSGPDLGSVGWIYWKDGKKTSKDKYFLFRVGVRGTISPSFWWNTQNYSNEDKSPFNDFEFQSSILEKFARIGFSEFGANLIKNSQNLESVSNNNAFTKRDHFVDLAKLSDEKTLNNFLKIFNEIIEKINLSK